MTIRAIGCVLLFIVPSFSESAPPPLSLTFEETVRMSDRIVIGTVSGTSGGSVRLPDGVEIGLGIKDPVTGLVFTSYRVRISVCLFDEDDSCRPGDSEVLIPGGTVYENVDGKQRLRTWEITGAAGVPLPPVGDDVLLFLTKRNDRYLPLNDSGARVRVDRSPGPRSVLLRFASPRFLSEAGREATRARIATGNPTTKRPVFIESVRLDRLKELIELARQAPKPTSGTRHATQDRVDASACDSVRKWDTRVRAGEVSQRRESPLGLGDDPDSIRRSGVGRRPYGP